MDHHYIDEHNIVDRYEMNKLSQAECALFEEHFVDCAKCQQQLAAAETFRRALQTVTAKDAATRADIGVPSSVLAWRPTSGWRALAAVAAVLVMGLGLTILFLTHEIGIAHRELAQAKVTGDDWQRKYNEENQTNSSLEKRLTETQQKSQDKNTGSGSMSTPIKVPALASIFALNTVRGGETGESPVNWVIVPKMPQSIILSPDWADAQNISDYRATLTDASGHIVWKENQRTPVSSPQFGITISSTLLHEGDYTLSLEAHSKPGGETISHRYPFHVKVMP